VFRSSFSFLIFAGIISLIFMIPAIFTPEIHDAIAPYLVVASVFLIGIPHGAIDHIISAELFNTGRSLRGHLIFYSSYLLIMLLVGLLWVWAPIAGMILFLIISVYHFGQADMEDFLLTGRNKYAAYVVRGIFILGLIIFSDTSVTLPIIAEATNINLAETAFARESSILALFGIPALYLLFSFSLTGIREIRRPLIFLSDFVLLLFLFAICGPLTGFAVYFTVWHSAGHIHEMQRFFNQKNKQLTITAFYKLAMPFTLISVFGLFILLLINNVAGMEGKLLTLMFILISVLTLPHMFIVDKLYSNRG
jgi:Brp/Blh family beta-carotene 15,15'-monooxygenase